MSSLGSNAKQSEYLLFGSTQLFVCLAANGHVPTSEKAPVALHRIQHGYKVPLAWMKLEDQGHKQQKCVQKKMELGVPQILRY